MKSQNIIAKSPQTGTLYLERSLEYYKKSLKGISGLHKLYSSDSDTISSDDLLRLAEKNFSEHNYMLAADFFSEYNQKISIIPSDKKTDILRKIYISNLKTKRFSSASSYLTQYLINFRNDKEKNYGKIIEILKSVTEYNKPITQNESQIRELYHLLRYSDLPSEYQNHIRYLLAIIAGRSGKTDIAFDLLSNIIQSSEDKKLISESLFFRGWLYWKSSKPDIASDIFLNILSKNNGKHTPLKEQCHLAIARIRVQQKRFSDALEHYQKINKSGKLFPDIIPEIIFAEVRDKNWEKALVYTREYLQQDDLNINLSSRLRTLIPYFLIQLHQTEKAHEIISKNMSDLEELKKDLHRKNQFPDFVTQSSYLSDLIKKISGMIEQPGILTDLKELSDLIEKIDKKQTSLESYLQRLLYHQSQKSTDPMDQKLYSHYEQISRLSEQLEIIGKSMLRIKYELIKENDNKNKDYDDIIKFISLLNTKKNQYIRSYHSYEYDLPFFDMENRVENILNKVSQIRSLLAASDFYQKSDAANKSKYYRKNISSSLKKLRETYESFRMLRINFSSDFYKTHPKRYLFNQIVDLIQKDFTEDPLIKNKYLSYQISYKPLYDLYKKWDEATLETQESFQKIEDTSKNYIKQFLINFNSVRQRMQTKKTEYKRFRELYENEFSLIMNEIHYQIEWNINQKLSQYSKWLADGKWNEMSEYMEIYNDLVQKQFNIKYDPESVRKGIWNSWPES